MQNVYFEATIIGLSTYCVTAFTSKITVHRVYYKLLNLLVIIF